MIHGRKLALTLLMSLALASCAESPEEGGESLDIDNVESTESASTDEVPQADEVPADQVAAAEQLQADPNAEQAQVDPNAVDPNANAAQDPNAVAVVTDPTTDPYAANPEPVPSSEPIAETPPAVVEAPIASTETPTAVPVSEPVAESTSPSPSFSGPTESYSVRSGDTLMLIAFEKYGDMYQWKRIYELNRDQLRDPSRLEVGATLKIDQNSGVHIDRNGEAYRIRRGDTLGSISRDVYGTSGKWRKLYENNRQLIKDPNKIYAGFDLYYQMSAEDMQDKERNRDAPRLGRKAIQEENQAAAPVPPMPEAPVAAPAEMPAVGNTASLPASGQDTTIDMTKSAPPAAAGHAPASQ